MRAPGQQVSSPAREGMMARACLSLVSTNAEIHRYLLGQGAACPLSFQFRSPFSNRNISRPKAYRASSHSGMLQKLLFRVHRHFGTQPALFQCPDISAPTSVPKNVSRPSHHCSDERSHESAFCAGRWFVVAPFRLDKQIRQSAYRVGRSALLSPRTPHSARIDAHIQSHRFT